ncbi:MAG: response regulator [Desulfobacterales bacterium]|nr:response regulator [Desulfobacterales bacterium]MBS3755655.1 response regulator [Desulfobacterales bacterium]
MSEDPDEKIPEDTVDRKTQEPAGSDKKRFSQPGVRFARRYEWGFWLLVILIAGLLGAAATDAWIRGAGLWAMMPGGAGLILLAATVWLLYSLFINPAKYLIKHLALHPRSAEADARAIQRVPRHWRPWLNLISRIHARLDELEQREAESRLDQKIEKNLLRRFSWVFERNEVLTRELQSKNEALEKEIEEHKRTGQELKRHRDNLDEMVKERTADLMRANRQLREAMEEARIHAKNAEEANQAKSQFLANVSHEVRTPLNAVLGFTDMLIDTSLDETQLDFAKTIRNSSEALLSLINDILDFSKIESGELDLEHIDFSPELLAYDVCELIRPQIGEKPIELICRVDQGLPSYLKGDPIRFQQVLLNLMGNAPKFTESGEITLGLHVGEQSENRLQIHATVKDSGIGISEDKQARIFEPFHQADGSTTRKYGGTGLGLSISRQLAQLMGGDIRLESEVDVGSTFHFTAWFERSDKGVSWQEVTAPIAGRQILIVDDNQANLDLLKNALYSAGLRVSDLRNGMEVVPTLQRAIVAGNPFDACIIDIHMPGMSGYEVARQVRASENASISNLPLIAASYLVERDPELFAQAGFDQSLVKPIRRERLFQVLVDMLAGEKKTGEPIKKESRQGVQEDFSDYGVLVAEDNAVNQKLIQMMLRKLGCRVALAGTGTEVVDMFSRDPAVYDLIFMDIQMPEMDGFEAFSALREKGFTDIPVVAMTAHAMAEHKEECLSAGMNDYISKPIRRPELIQVLQRFLS